MPGMQNITIEQQLAEIGIQNVPAQMKIEQQRLKMHIKTEQAQMEIEHKNPSFKINRKKINSESGLKSTPELSKDYRDKGRSGALRGARTAVQDGNFLGDVKRHGDKVGSLAHQKTMSAVLRKKQTNVGLMPKSMPEIEWERGSLNINWSKNSIVIDWDGEYMPKVTLDPKYSVEVYMRTSPYFRITVSEAEDPSRPGMLVDKAI